MDDNIEVGSIVRSNAGRDKGKFLIVVGNEGDYVFLADGNLRRIESPKKKKSKHVLNLNVKNDDICDKIMNSEKITNAFIRKELSKFLEENIE